MTNCPECRSRNLVDRTYTPMGTRYWRFYQCRECGWEDHQPETPVQSAARVMKKS